jgi:hypothetical protein
MVAVLRAQDFSFDSAAGSVRNEWIGSARRRDTATFGREFSVALIPRIQARPTKSKDTN